MQVCQFVISTYPHSKMQRIFSLLASIFFAFLVICPVASQAEENSIEITNTTIEKTADNYKLSTHFSFELNRGLESALHRGVPLYFTTQIELSRPRWYWFDATPVSTSRTIRIAYNVLTREYSVTTLGSIQQNFSSLEDALFLVRRPHSWNIAKHNQLESGETYTAMIRMMLDVSQLPKPFQINVINNRDWRLSSDWKRFSFTA